MFPFLLLCNKISAAPHACLLYVNLMPVLTLPTTITTKGRGEPSTWQRTKGQICLHTQPYRKQGKSIRDLPLSTKSCSTTKDILDRVPAHVGKGNRVSISDFPSDKTGARAGFMCAPILFFHLHAVSVKQDPSVFDCIQYLLLATTDAVRTLPLPSYERLKGRVCVMNAWPRYRRLSP